MACANACPKNAIGMRPHLTLVLPAFGASIHDIDFSLDIFIEVKVEFASEKDRIHRKK